jgi:hypothetical protein
MEPTEAFRIAEEIIDPQMLDAFVREYAKRKKSLVVAYIAWILMGSHYLYLGKTRSQFAFWLTLGGSIFWWLMDLFRLPGVVAEHNTNTVLELMARYRTHESGRPGPHP